MEEEGKRRKRKRTRRRGRINGRRLKKKETGG